MLLIMLLMLLSIRLILLRVLMLVMLCLIRLSVRCRSVEEFSTDLEALLVTDGGFVN